MMMVKTPIKVLHVLRAANFFIPTDLSTGSSSLSSALPRDHICINSLSLSLSLTHFCFCSKFPLNLPEPHVPSGSVPSNHKKNFYRVKLHVSSFILYKPCPLLAVGRSCYFPLTLWFQAPPPRSCQSHTFFCLVLLVGCPLRVQGFRPLIPKLCHAFSQPEPEPRTKHQETKPIQSQSQFFQPT